MEDASEIRRTGIVSVQLNSVAFFSVRHWEEIYLHSNRKYVAKMRLNISSLYQELPG